MSETGFLVFNVTFALTLELLYGACLALFLGPFLPRRRTGVLVLAAYLVLRLLWDGAAIPQGMFGVLLVGLPVLGARGLGLDRGLAHQGAYDRLEDYLTKMDESLGGGDWAAQTGDPVTDMIVGDAERRCLEAGVRFQADFRFPGDGGYDAFDLGIILQNLLENALEACGKVPEGERYLTLTGRRRGRFFLLEVKNPYAGQVVFGPDGLPLTTKTEDAPLHGLGLTNARREAEKYTGQLELRAEGQVFTATVLLQERSQNV